jgi:methyl coenzyme M reductase subunit C
MGERQRQRKTNIKAANVAISTLNPINHSGRAIKTSTRNPTKYLHIKMREEYKIKKNEVLVAVNNRQKKKIAYQARLKLKETSSVSHPHALLCLFI